MHEPRYHLSNQKPVSDGHDLYLPKQKNVSMFMNRKVFDKYQYIHVCWTLHCLNTVSSILGR